MAQIYLRSQSYDRAQDHIDAVLNDDPANERALVLHASALASQDRLDDALAIYRELDMDNRPDLALGMARIMLEGGRKSQALQIVKPIYEEQPENVQLLAFDA